ncbi:class I SAM-dependent methyltransferase [Roseomonas sp. JC162]|uniref:Class I SAM-dependent methyltransferase n=1 Tax=Neoroseomonas marina TaxID=1232220 RepID=A0A848EBX8_9PROT|nr:class I SAM-dependent methyltransferase [Neoroseomonas marina]NMJ41019.1 class I SAM-dependent methyltransferase [Neoroseomonas marina]
MDRETSSPSGSAAEALDWASRQPAWWHDSGNLNIRVLDAVARHGQGIGLRESAETGCGLSTVVLSTIAERHTCFTIAEGDSLEKVRAVPHLQAERVDFVIGPSQRTLPSFDFPRPLDLVLIDGPHGFPFAHLEYYFFYPRVRSGGILVVDDIHIPTIRQLYDVLRDDRMWEHVEDVLTTAFFRRTEAPVFDPFGDGWERQQFNQRHFAQPEVMDIYAPGWRALMPPPPAPLLGQNSDVVPTQAADALRQEVARLRAENAALRASTSWRVTAPLRSIGSLLRR